MLLVALILLSKFLHGDQHSVKEIWEILQNDHFLVNGIIYPFDGRFSGERWSLVGDSMIEGDRVVLTTDTKSQTGGIWSPQPHSGKYWALLMEFIIHDHRNRRDLFGDGMALWYVRNPGRRGQAFGYSNDFYGLGVFFDTFNNRGESSVQFPFVSASVDAQKNSYNHSDDGASTIQGGCPHNVRNSPTQALLIYDQDSLNLYLKNHDSNPYSSDGFTPCVSLSNVVLPSGLYFGVTAATGDLTDNHELISLRVINLQEGAEEDWSLVPSVARTEGSVFDSKESIKRGFSVALMVVICICGVIGFVIFMFVGRTSRDKLF